MTNPSTLYYNDDCLNSSKYIADESVDLFFLDPPYYISGSKKKNLDLVNGDRNDWDRQWENKADFYVWTRNWMKLMFKQLKQTGSAYICISWEHSGSFQNILENVGFKVRNRITWKRDKGRGSKNNWKSIHEDIWFVTKSNDYTFNVDEVMERKEVIAPYRDSEGNPKGWKLENGKPIRYTHPGNLWTEFTVPFWSMKEVRSYAKSKRSKNNKYSKHNTQKPLSLVNKCITASSNVGDLVADYFVGSGTTAIAAINCERKAIVMDVNSTCIGMLKCRLENEIGNLFIN